MHSRRKPTPLKVLVVCAGNTCRSPMAGGLLRHLAAESGRLIDVRTGGLAPHVGRRVEPKAVKVMAELGIDVSDEYSKGVSADDVNWADAIVVLEAEHAAYIREDHPSCADKIMLLPKRVPDPFMQSLAVYRARRDQLANLVRSLPLWGPRRRSARRPGIGRRR